MAMWIVARLIDGDEKGASYGVYIDDEEYGGTVTVSSDLSDPPQRSTGGIATEIGYLLALKARTTFLETGAWPQAKQHMS